jgi:hypothetical protein
MSSGRPNAAEWAGILKRAEGDNTRFIREHAGVRGWLSLWAGDAIDHFVMAITSADVLVRYGVFAENSPTGEGELS